MEAEGQLNSARPSPLNDGDARRQAACVFDRPVFVEAGAGTGKTTLLIHRLLVWALDVGWQKTSSLLRAKQPALESDAENIANRVLDRVVAITFTEAAATELSDRFANAIRAASELQLPKGFDRSWLRPDDSALAERARCLLPLLDRAHISTIHSWCFEVLRRHAYVADVRPDVEIVADAQEIEAIARGVVERHYSAAYERGLDADLVRLGEEKIGPRDWIEIARTWVSAGWSSEVQLPEDDGLQDALGQIRKSAADLWAAAPLELKKLGGRNLAPKVLAAAEATADLPTEDDTCALEQLKELWPDNLRRRVQAWSEGTFNRSETNATGGSGEAIQRATAGLALYLPIMRRLAPKRWARRRRALSGILKDLAIALDEASAITFGGLLHRTAGLLGDRPEIAAAERRRIDLLLVDEFQDTDALQASMVTALALEGDERPALMVVGDPKQSIYGWRSADLETYQGVQDAVHKENGLELILNCNFRSSPEILAASDLIVGGQMRPDPGFQPAYHPLRSTAPNAEESSTSVEIWRGDGDLRAAESARRESEWVAHDLDRLHSDGELEWHQVGILMRSKTHVRSLLRALRGRGVPYVLNADAGFHQRSEVIDAAAWVRVVADPTDQVALLKVCRSPVVGVPDGALLSLWHGSFLETMEAFTAPNEQHQAQIRESLAAAEATLNDVPGIDKIPDWVNHAAAALGTIGDLRQALRELPFASFIELLRQRTKIEAVEARRPEGAARVANLRKLFDQLVHQVEDSGGDTHAVLRVLRRGIFFEVPAEEALPLTPADGAVQIATIHAAKGLEFDHVYLIHTGSAGARDDLDLQVEPTIPGAALIQSVAHPQWALGRMRRNKVAKAEALRLLYVALTRARRHLVVSLPGRAVANTLAALVEPALETTPADWIHHQLDEAPPPPRRQDSTVSKPLANPPWTEIPAPAPLHVSPTGDDPMDELEPNPSEFGSSQLQLPLTENAASSSDAARQRGDLVHQVLAAVGLTSDEPMLPQRFSSDPEAMAFWNDFATTELGTKFLNLGDRLRGREVEVLAPGSMLEGASATFAAGRIDLLYVDENDDWTLVDFKTGRPANPRALIDRYRRQLRFYAQSIAEALSLPQPPRVELWFVDLDRIEVVEDLV